MASVSEAPLQVILVAPNVCQRMGGEAIKALQIYEILAECGLDVHQVTHARVREELTRLHPEISVTYIEDDAFSMFCFRSVVLRGLLDPYFRWKAARVVRGLLREKPHAIVHYTSPISPVNPVFATPGAPVVMGPLNGNITYPPAFRNRERLGAKLRRLAYPWALLMQRPFLREKRRVDVILVAGGARTARALRLAGCRPQQFRETLDSGIPQWVAELPRITHQGLNLKFVHSGRLVAYKGTELIFRALLRTRLPVELDVIGQGPERERLEALASDLKLGDRVRFIPWKPHAELVASFAQYRACVLPSLAEANGIVVQEAMVRGLPVICVDWGGPALLVVPECGIAIAPRGEAHVIAELASAMDRLAEDGDRAERMSVAGRERALSRGFLWNDLIESWLAIYQELRVRKT